MGLRDVFPPLILSVVIMSSFDVAAAPSRGQYYQDPTAIAMREMHNSIEDVRHEVSNHEVEIRILDEKMKNFDLIVENVREQLDDSSKMHKEQLKGSSASLESKIQSLENTSVGLVTDLRMFKTHTNETMTALAQYKQKITELEKIIEVQNQNINHLQAGLRLLMEAVQGKVQDSAKSGENIASTGSDRTYKVKAGDSLEKIARGHQVTIQSIKDVNGLTTDRIVVGKTLIIPEK